MLINRLHSFLIPRDKKINSKQIRFWLCLSILFAIIYGIQGLQVAFSSEFVVQDDARQHVFWMRRFIEPDLFPNDLIANYYQSVAPWGYTTLYRGAAFFGIDPMVFNKFLPIVLGIITTVYCFGLSWQILPIPAGGFVTTLLLNQSLWMKDDLVSATPRAFAYPLFLAFLYYLSRRSLPLVCAAIALLGIFYAQFVLLCSGMLILQLWSWDGRHLPLSREKEQWRFCLIGLGIAFLVLLPLALETSEFGSTITLAQARISPEFQPGGRSRFFYPTPEEFWLVGNRSGIFPRGLLTPGTLYVGIFLPILLLLKDRLPVLRQLKTSLWLLPQLFWVSLGVFFAAHAVLFKLYLPSRYTHQSLRVIIAIMSAIAILSLIDAILSWGTKQPVKQGIALGITLLITLSLVLYPNFVKGFPLANYQIGSVPTLYKFFLEQPKDSLIASLSEEANNLPSFSLRSILVGREYGIPYHTGYYKQFRQRTLDLIQAQYSPELAQVKNFIQKYGVDFWLLDQNALEPSYLKNTWLQQFQPNAANAQQQLVQGTQSALSRVLKSCNVFKTDKLVVLSAKCLMVSE